MKDLQIIWDMEDDEEGNYWHICVEGHDVTREEVNEVLHSRDSQETTSRTSKNPITFGWTTSGKYIAVVWERVQAKDPKILYPLTAYPVNPPRRKR
jgi:hypothetical protein